MFATLSWNETAKAAREASAECPGIELFAVCGGEELWDAHTEHQPALAAKDEDTGSVEVRINGAVVMNSSKISNPLLAWMGDVSQLKGKREWRIGLTGDSTVRDLTSSWIEMFLGSQDALKANAKKCFTMSLRVETQRAILHIQ